MIRRRLTSESGLTLIEVLIASSLMLVVLSATLTTFEGFLKNNRKNERQNDQQQVARESIDQIVKQLRNLANPTTTVPTINYADPYRIVFQTTDPTKQWVSYCLDNDDPSNEILWYQTSAKGSIASQAGAACPSATTSDDPTTPDPSATDDWANQNALVENVTNRLPSDRSVFEYAGFNGVAVATGGGGVVTDTSAITRVTATLFVDVNPGQDPGETSIQSGAHMRNQNQTPVGSFVTLRNGSTYTFDASASSDAEGRTLAYFWYSTPTVPTASQIPPTSTNTTPQSELPACTSSDSSRVIPSAGGVTWTCLGTGVVLTKNFNAATDGASPRYIWLMAVDPGGLATLSKTTTGGSCSAYNAPAATLDQKTCREVTY